MVNQPQEPTKASGSNFLEIQASPIAQSDKLGRTLSAVTEEYSLTSKDYPTELGQVENYRRNSDFPNKSQLGTISDETDPENPENGETNFENAQATEAQSQDHLGPAKMSVQTDISNVQLSLLDESQSQIVEINGNSLSLGETVSNVNSMSMINSNIVANMVNDIDKSLNQNSNAFKRNSLTISKRVSGVLNAIGLNQKQTDSGTASLAGRESELSESDAGYNLNVVQSARNGSSKSSVNNNEQGAQKNLLRSAQALWALPRALVQSQTMKKKQGGGAAGKAAMGTVQNPNIPNNIPRNYNVSIPTFASTKRRARHNGLRDLIEGTQQQINAEFFSMSVLAASKGIGYGPAQPLVAAGVRSAATQKLGLVQTLNVSSVTPRGNMLVPNQGNLNSIKPNSKPRASAAMVSPISDSLDPNIQEQANNKVPGQMKRRNFFGQRSSSFDGISGNNPGPSGNGMGIGPAINVIKAPGESSRFSGKLIARSGFLSNNISARNTPRGSPFNISRNVSNDDVIRSQRNGILTPNLSNGSVTPNKPMLLTPRILTPRINFTPRRLSKNTF